MEVIQQYFGPLLDWCSVRLMLFSCLVFSISLYFSPGLVLLMLISLFLGIITVSHHIGKFEIVPNFLGLFQRKKEVQAKTCSSVKSCPVCGKVGCNRHRSELNFIDLQPWGSVQVPQRVDEALQQFYEQILEEYVYSWYREVSSDEEFVDEIRSTLRYATAFLYKRLRKVDVPIWIHSRLLRHLLRHLHYYLKARNQAIEPASLQDRVLQCYGDSLHFAVRSRKSELQYLRSLTRLILPIITPRESLSCRSIQTMLQDILSAAVFLPAMDLLALPDSANHILVMLFDDNIQMARSVTPSPAVPLLVKFSQPRSKRTSCLYLNLEDIVASPDLLFPFMNFLKAESSVSVLQFYLSAEELNSRLLTPELKPSELQQIHEQLSSLYRCFMDADSPDSLHFDPDILTQIKEVCDEGPRAVLRLQTTAPLFRAYDHVYELLINVFLPLFHHSDHFYELICGSRFPASSLTPTHLSQTKTSSGRSRMKDVKSVIADGRTAPTDEETLTSPEVERADDDPASPKLTAPTPLHDLSTWRVSVPKVVTRPDLNSYYEIHVRRTDVPEDHLGESAWKIYRRYNEFYVLEQKLNEFHDELEGCELPSKKSFGTRSLEFLETRRLQFQDYLQMLMSVAHLRNSQLLNHFLRSASTEFSSNILPDINVGKIFKSTASKLVRERGQNLEPFLQSFLESVEPPPVKPRKLAKDEEDGVSICSEKFSNVVFCDNAGLPETKPVHFNEDCVERIPVEGAFDMLMYLVDRVYCCSGWVHNVMISLRILFKTILDDGFDYFLQSEIKKMTEEERLVEIIHIIQEAVFNDQSSPTTEEMEYRKHRAFQVLSRLFPDPFIWAVGSRQHEQAIQLLLDALQLPTANKQLCYVLLDDVLKELLPELIQHNT